MTNYNGLIKINSFVHMYLDFFFNWLHILKKSMQHTVEVIFIKKLKEDFLKITVKYGTSVANIKTDFYLDVYTILNQI